MPIARILSGQFSKEFPALNVTYYYYPLHCLLLILLLAPTPQLSVYSELSLMPLPYGKSQDPQGNNLE